MDYIGDDAWGRIIEYLLCPPTSSRQKYQFRLVCKKWNNLFFRHTKSIAVASDIGFAFTNLGDFYEEEGSHLESNGHIEIQGLQEFLAKFTRLQHITALWYDLSRVTLPSTVTSLKVKLGHGVLDSETVMDLRCHPKPEVITHLDLDCTQWNLSKLVSLKVLKINNGSRSSDNDLTVIGLEELMQLQEAHLDVGAKLYVTPQIVQRVINLRKLSLGLIGAQHPYVEEWLMNNKELEDLRCSGFLPSRDFFSTHSLQYLRLNYKGDHVREVLPYLPVTLKTLRVPRLNIEVSSLNHLSSLTSLTCLTIDNLPPWIELFGMGGSQDWDCLQDASGLKTLILFDSFPEDFPLKLNHAKYVKYLHSLEEIEIDSKAYYIPEEVLPFLIEHPTFRFITIHRLGETFRVNREELPHLTSKIPLQFDLFCPKESSYV